MVTMALVFAINIEEGINPISYPLSLLGIGSQSCWKSMCSNNRLEEGVLMVLNAAARSARKMDVFLCCLSV